MATEPWIVVHGGVGAPSAWSDGCEEAVTEARRTFRAGGDALAAAIAAVVRLEDDGRFNAGRGSALRLDGVTREMDAAVSASDGRLGIVAVIRDVKNPVLVAEAVSRLPHVMLAGEGATRFARRLGMPPSGEIQEARRQRYEKALARLAAGSGLDDLARWNGVRPSDVWNFEGPPPAALGCDTVGAVVRGADGLFAVATSTGGTTLTLLGRVGDSPLPGCGFHAGSAGAAAPTGVGEEIIVRYAAREAYDRIAAGASPEEACAGSVALFPEAVPYGIIAIGRDGAGAAHNRDMPWAQGAL